MLYMCAGLSVNFCPIKNYFEKISFIRLGKFFLKCTVNDMMQKEQIEKLFRCYYREMFRLANLLLHDEAESKDAVSEVFVQLMNRADDLQKETERAFLMQSIRNRCLNVIRKRSLQQQILKLYLLDIQTEIYPVEVREEELTVIRSIIDTQLTATDRHILFLHFRQKLKYREIAEEQGISEVAVYKHLRKSLDIIRNHFKKV